MAADDDDKTEEPTPRKLEQAREKGDIIYTPEVGTALSLIALTSIVAFMAGPISSQMAHAFLGFLSMPDQYSAEPAVLEAILGQIGLKLLAIFGLACLALAAAGVTSRYLQDKATFTADKLSPKIEKLNPIEGFKRVFGKAAVASFLKSLAKLGVVGGIMLWTLVAEGFDARERCRRSMSARCCHTCRIVSSPC